MFFPPHKLKYYSGDNSVKNICFYLYIASIIIMMGKMKHASLISQPIVKKSCLKYQLYSQKVSVGRDICILISRQIQQGKIFKTRKEAHKLEQILRTESSGCIIPFLAHMFKTFFFIHAFQTAFTSFRIESESIGVKVFIINNLLFK